MTSLCTAPVTAVACTFPVRMMNLVVGKHTAGNHIDCAVVALAASHMLAEMLGQ